MPTQQMRLALDELPPVARGSPSEVAGHAKEPKAVQYIRDGLTACIPPRAPFPIANFIQAAFTRKDTATATVELFDGKKGVIEISKWTKRYEDAWCMQWLELEGGAFQWNGAAWERVGEP